MFGSGNAVMALDQYGQGLANQDYGNWLSRLSGLNSQGLQAAFGQTGRQGALAGINQWAPADAQRISMGQEFSARTQGNMADVAANAQGGANLFNALGGGLNLLARLSDRRDKKDIQRLGREPSTGINIYAYRYRSDPKTYPKVVGPMADEVQKKYPHAVKEINGHKVIDVLRLAAAA